MKQITFAISADKVNKIFWNVYETNHFPMLIIDMETRKWTNACVYYRRRRKENPVEKILMRLFVIY